MLSRMSRRFLLFCLSSLLAIGCARQGYPEGGPRDREAPVVTNETPANGTLNFNAPSFYIAFDEYVVVQDADNNVIISPPMRPKPTFTTKGRGILVTLNDTLQPNTTYLFQFKNAIADFHEGNKLATHDYAFSTGNTIDSMTIAGTVLDAMTLGARKEVVTLMLYPADSPDSCIAHQQPSHITRSNADGSFRFTHLKPGHYRIVAIEDADKDLRHGPNEAIAFADGPAVAHAATDSTAETLQMLMSFEPRQVQRVAQSGFVREGYAEVVSVMPMQNPSVQTDTALVWRLSPQRDTLRIWTRNPSGRLLHLVLTDSSGLHDTLKMQWRPRRSKTGASTTAPPWCQWSIGTTLPYFQPMRLTFTTPLDTLRSRPDSAVVVMRIADSSRRICRLIADSTLMSATVDFVPMSNEKYEVTLIASQMYNILGATTDSLKVGTEVQGEDKFGTILVKIHQSDSQSRYVVQLTDESGKVLQSQKIEESGRVDFRRLTPATYRIQAFADRNGDGLWTPGNYYQHRQPEPYYFMGKSLTLRANWDIEEDFTVGGTPKPNLLQPADTKSTSKSTTPTFR